MTTKLVTDDIWFTLSSAVQASSKPCYVAVAYFGRGAAKFLPLPEGSRIVVDASDRAVRSGLTCPDELLRLHRKGVKIYSMENLHAKVFVVGRTAFVGSSNVSTRSANTLIEAVLKTTEKDAVARAVRFVRDLCLDSLGPTRLKKLSAIYRPPVLPGGGRNEGTTRRPKLKELYVAVIDEIDFPEEEDELRETGLKTARRDRRHRGDSHEIDEVRWRGRCPFRKDQIVAQAFRESNGKSWVYPPGFVLNIVKAPGKDVRYLYLERPRLRRYAMETMCKKLGRGTKTRLSKSGRVTDREFARELLRVWHS